MAIDEAGKYEIDFRLRQKEGEFQQAIALAHGMKIEALADDGVVVPGQPVKVNVIVANRGNGEVAIKNVKIDGFGGDTRVHDDRVQRRRLLFPGRQPPAAANAPEAPMPSVRKDQVAHCEPTLTIPADARVSEPVLASQRRGGPLYLRRRRAVRPADAPVAVLRAGDADAAGRRGNHPGSAGAAPLRGRHLQRREAQRPAGRPGVLGARDAAGCDRARVVDPQHPGPAARAAQRSPRPPARLQARGRGGSPARAAARRACQQQRRPEPGARDSRHRAERHDRRRRDVGEARAAAGLERDARPNSR